jgi:hypothetical protein
MQNTVSPRPFLRGAGGAIKKISDVEEKPFSSSVKYISVQNLAVERVEGRAE